jgi:hypothetical protein
VSKARLELNEQHVSLCEVLDRVLNKGVVVTGEVVISVADIELLYVGLQLIVTSVETLQQQRALAERSYPGEANDAR